MNRPRFSSLCVAALSLPTLAFVACSSAPESSAPPAAPTVLAATPLAAEDFCNQLAQIVCTADTVCCDGASTELGTGVPDAVGNSGGGSAVTAGSGGGGGGGGNGSGGGDAIPPSCVTMQTGACNATVGKLVMDPRTGYDPALGGQFMANAKTAGTSCWSQAIHYDDLIAALAGSGALGSDCTPEDTSVDSLRVAALSCQRSSACHLYLRADGTPTGVCEARTDDSCSHPLDCAAGQWCDLPGSWTPGNWGQCHPLRANGWACAGDLECESSHCGADGMCGASDTKDLCLTTLYSNAVKVDQPLGYWRLAEKSGESSDDASGNGNMGKRNGNPDSLSPGALTGDKDRATSFDGVDDQIALSAGMLSGKAALSLEGWFSISADSGGKPLLAFGDEKSGGPVVAVADAGDAMKVDLVDTTGTSHAMTSKAATIAAGQWCHVVATYDGAHGELYIDGAKAANVDAVFTPRMDGSFYIGSGAAGATFFKGGADEVAVYGSVLTADRIAEHHRIGKNGPAVDMWRFFSWFK